MDIAQDNGLNTTAPETQKEWAKLAHDLSIKVIHIAERDTQICEKTKRPDEFVNTWSVDGFVVEISQPAELGWGTHERHWPRDASHHEFGSQCSIYLNRAGGSTRVRTWTPLSGAFHAYLITHTEAVSIADFLTLKEQEKVYYRPTVHFAYHPCEDAVLSLQEFAGKEWQQQSAQRILFSEIVDGMDELGVLLMGNKKGAYWFGSQLGIHETRKLVPYNNATSLQVAIGALSGMIWVMKNPCCGIVEPDEIDYQFILNIAKPYLGTISGHYTDWTPLNDREKLFPENIDKTDPGSFEYAGELISSIRSQMSAIPNFHLHLARNLVFGFILILAALYIGMLGYHFFENMSWVDAFANAAMILSGMGPLTPLSTNAGKIFAGSYALFSGLAFIVIIAIVFSPIIRRFFHQIHLESKG